MKKRTIRDKISQAAMEKPGLNRKLLTIRKSLDEVNKVLAKNGKSDKK